MSKRKTTTRTSVGGGRSRHQAQRRPPLRKALGQHHLRSGNLVRPLVDYLNLGGATGSVLEIGPGGGVLTLELLRTGTRVLAVELDRKWAFALAERLRLEGQSAEAGAWALSVGDALDLDWSRLESHHRVAGNLPYGVATAILRRVLASAASGVRLGFLVQLEVAQRICAGPGDPQYGALSVQVRARTEQSQGAARILGRVKPGSFVPPPKVESAFVGLCLSDPAVLPEQWPGFCDLVFAGFSQRRKTLLNSLSSRFPRPEVAAALECSGVGPRQRAEELDVAVWVRVFQHLVEL